MNYVYYCFGGAHTSVTCAAIHLGLLPREVPTASEVMSFPWFDRGLTSEIGTPRLLGVDGDGHNVYFVGLGLYRRQMVALAKAIISMKGKSEDYLFVNSLAGVHVFTRVGGFTSRRLNLVRWGRYIAAMGIRLRWARLQQTVAEAKAEVRRRPA